MTTRFWCLASAWGSLPKTRWDAPWRRAPIVMVSECPLDPAHGGKFVRQHPLSVRLRSSKPADFLQSTIGEWLCSRRVREAFRDANLTGYEMRSAEVYYPGQKKPDTEEYAELCVSGWGGIASSRSGVALLMHCPGCNRQEYRLPYPERVIDETCWDGSDFFLVWPLTQTVFCSEAAHSVITANSFTGVNLVPAEEFVSGTGRCSPDHSKLSDAQLQRIRERFGF